MHLNRQITCGMTPKYASVRRNVQTITKTLTICRSEEELSLYLQGCLDKTNWDIFEKHDLGINYCIKTVNSVTVSKYL